MKTPILLFWLALAPVVPAHSADKSPATVPATGTAASTMQPSYPDYESAARFAPSRLRKMVGSISARPNWLKHSDRFWYEYRNAGGKSWYLVDPARRRQTLLFDNEAVAAELALIMQDAFDAHDLPLKEIEFIDDDRAVRFEVKSSQVDEVEKKKAEAEAKAKAAARAEEDKKNGRKNRPDKDDKPKKDFKKIYTFEYELASGRLRHLPDYVKPEDDPGWANISPDEEKVIYGKGYDLYWMDRENFAKAVEDEDDPSVVEHRLTEDGEAFYDYFGASGASRLKSDETEEERAKKRVRANAVWSQDSSRIALVRYDRRQVGQLWVIDSLAKPRPTLETYPYAMPGEEEVGVSELWVFDLGETGGRQLQVAAFEDQDLNLLRAPTAKKDRGDRRHAAQWLSARRDRLLLYRLSRDLKRIDLLDVDVETAAVKVLVEERFNTANDYRSPWVSADGSETIFWSERNGWGHFYLYDDQGQVKNAITRGAFHAFDIEGVDEKKRVLYFSAYGREDGMNPYYRQLYRVNFDGSNMRRLTAGDFDHQSDVCDSTQYFVDTYSRVDTAPRSELYDGGGKAILTLQEADLSQLTAAGYQFPEVFSVKADDGITDLYGVMYKPFRFDPAKKYPVIAYVYPGPQTEAVDSAFGISGNGQTRFPAMHLPALAQFGYIVVTVGNRGGHPARSRAYQDFSYKGNFRDYGLADKKWALEQLSARHAFIDIDKVGIFGHSGGGFMSTAAMLVYPDFFKVAVSSSGNHQNSIYNRWWSERYHGVQEEVDEEGEVSFKFSVAENAELVRNLKGHLLLATGGVDSNVHPANTYRMVEALIQAGKRFDMLVIPSAAHGYPGAAGEYFFWARADYFNRYLYGWAPDSVDMVEMLREVPATRK